jgi:hypothetical protein
MATLHPTAQERRAIQNSAIHGDESARNFLELIDACTQILEGTNGISLARGMVGEHNDVYGEAIDDALSELMPVIYKISATGWESLKYYVPQEMQAEKEQPTPSTGSYKADQAKALKQMEEDREYLNQAIRQAAESGNPAAEARVTLQYHQAMLHALMFLTPGTNCDDQENISELAETAHKLDHKRAEYAATPGRLGVPEIKAFIENCTTRLETVQKLCTVCQERLQYWTLANFRSFHSTQEPKA